MSEITLTPKQEAILLNALGGIIRERSMPEIGQKLRHYRAERSMRMMDMARDLNMGSADLSGIETGRLPEPDDFMDRVKAAYTDFEGTGG